MDSVMCKETERLVRILGSSENPTDMALIILANKIDKLDEKIDKLDKATEFARWIDRNKKIISGILIALMTFAVFGLKGLVDLLKGKIGL